MNHCTPEQVLRAQARFELGSLVTTRGAADVLPQYDVMVAICRHARGDWGDLDEHDVAVNERALIEGTRLLSVYQSTLGQRFWIITEADRSVTTVLLPEEY